MKNIFAVEKFDLVTGFQSNYRLLDTRLAFRSALLWNIFAVKDSGQGSFQSSFVRSKCILCVYQCISVCKCNINCSIRVYGNLCGEFNHKITLIKAASCVWRRRRAVGCLIKLLKFNKALLI